MATKQEWFGVITGVAILTAAVAAGAGIAMENYAFATKAIAAMIGALLINGFVNLRYWSDSDTVEEARTIKQGDEL